MRAECFAGMESLACRDTSCHEMVKMDSEAYAHFLKQNFCSSEKKCIYMHPFRLKRQGGGA